MKESELHLKMLKGFKKYLAKEAGKELKQKGGSNKYLALRDQHTKVMEEINKK